VSATISCPLSAEKRHLSPEATPATEESDCSPAEGDIPPPQVGAQVDSCLALSLPKHLLVPGASPSMGPGGIHCRSTAVPGKQQYKTAEYEPEALRGKKLHLCAYTV